jgi:2-hydroxychromene-2-carboxylate isomerase
MQFTGRLFYDFVSADVWRFFQMLISAQNEGAQLGVEWKPFLVAGVPGELDAHARLLAAAEIVRNDAVLNHGAFVAAVLTAVHAEGMALESDEIIPLALRLAQLDAGFLGDGLVATQGRAHLEASQAEAATLGVDAVPTVYRHGPVVAVRTTSAVTMGSGLHRLEMINAMLEDDGLWELRKP